MQNVDFIQRQRRNIKADVYIDRKKFEQVEEIVYLGSEIMSDGWSNQKLEQRSALAKTAFSNSHKLFL